MKIYALCGRRISNTRYTYSLDCLKKMCNSVNVHNVKNLICLYKNDNTKNI